MHKYLLTLAAGAALAAACTHDKPAAESAVTSPSADTAVVLSNRDTAAYRLAAERTAQRVAQDLGLTETVVITQLVPVYVERSQAFDDLNGRYATDTTGRYAAQRAANDAADRRVRAIVTEPAKYRTYETNRGTYYEGTPYSPPATETAAAPEEKPTAPARRKGPAVVKYENDGGDVKIKYANGTTVKIDKDGDRKTEYPNGTKVKRDADDGERKVKN